MIDLRILKMRVNLSNIKEVTDRIVFLCKNKMGSYVCVSNVHMCMEVYDSPEFERIVNSSDLTVTDGKPIYLIARIKSIFRGRDSLHSFSQVRGEDLVYNICKHANSSKDIKVGFYGGFNNDVLKLVNEKLTKLYPGLQIVFEYSPPFRSKATLESEEIIERINASGTNILFVGLGCPKQESWMYLHRDKIKCCSIGVGAAFDFISGSKQQAPNIFKALYLEWFFRLLCEPKRLWKRYLILNPRFIMLNILSMFNIAK